jgi:SpoVK/Ycf46/Vps4 family AAA+-type ATPase
LSSGADISALVREAAVAAIQEALTICGEQSFVKTDVKLNHFETAFTKVFPSVSKKVFKQKITNLCFDWLQHIILNINFADFRTRLHLTVLESHSVVPVRR